MPVPASVLELLESHKVNYNIATSGTPTFQADKPSQEGCLVKSLLLEDSQGRVQVLIPAKNIIDLGALKHQFGRDLQGLEREELSPLFSQYQLKSIPAFPQWQGMPTLVDSSLLQHTTLWLDSGDSDQLLEVQQDDFEEITKAASIGEFSNPILVEAASTENDEKQIVHALDSFTELRIKQRLEETLELPPLPDTAQRIIKLRADPNSDINDLTNIVEIDPSLAAQVVGWASSPFYSAPGKIKSVHDAIVRVLGFDMVMNLSLGLALGRTFNLEVMKIEQIRSYWRDSVYMAAIVEGLVTSIPREFRPGFGMAYLSGLLSNFGYLIMAEVFPPYFNNIDRYHRANPHAPVAAIEQYLLGVSGNQMASWLLDTWNMPEEVIMAIRYQNNPNYNDKHMVYSKLIHIAGHMLRDNEVGNALGDNISQPIFESLHLEKETAQITVENILESAADLDQIADRLKG